jgi:hypothetical protein
MWKKYYSASAVGYDAAFLWHASNAADQHLLFAMIVALHCSVCPFVF